MDSESLRDRKYRIYRKRIQDAQEVGLRMDRKWVFHGQEVDPRTDRKWVSLTQELSPGCTEIGSLRDRNRVPDGH